VSSDANWPTRLVALAPNVPSASTIIDEAYEEGTPFPFHLALLQDDNTTSQSAYLSFETNSPNPMLMLSDTGRLIYKVQDWSKVSAYQPVLPDSNPPRAFGQEIPQRDRILVYQLSASDFLDTAIRDDQLIANSSFVYFRNTAEVEGEVIGEVYYFSDFRFFALGDEDAVTASVPSRVRHYCRGGDLLCPGYSLTKAIGSNAIDFDNNGAPCGGEIRRSNQAASMYNFVNDSLTQLFPSATGQAGCQSPGPCGFGMDVFDAGGTGITPYPPYVACIVNQGVFDATRILSRSLTGVQSQVPDRGISFVYSALYNFTAMPALQGLATYGAEANASQTVFENGVYLAKPHYFFSPPSPVEGAIRMIHSGLSVRDVSQGWESNGANFTVDMTDEPGTTYQGRLSATRFGSILAVTNFAGTAGIPSQPVREALVARIVPEPQLALDFADEVVSYIHTGQKLPLPPEVFVADANWTPPAAGEQDATGVFLRANQVILRPDKSVVLFGEYYQDTVANNQPDYDSVRYGIWLYTVADGWQPIAVAGQYAIDGTTVLGRYAVTNTSSTTITANSERDEIVYSTEYFSPSDNANRGGIFYRSNVCAVTRVVMKTGDSYTLPSGPTGVIGALTLVGGNNGEDGRPQTFNNRGQLAFAAGIKFSQNGTTETYDAILVTSANPAPATCGDIDFNNNGVFPEDEDVIDFFAVLAGSTPATCDPVLGCDDIDINNNGVFPEDADVTCFFSLLAGGNCDGVCN